MKNFPILLLFVFFVTATKCLEDFGTGVEGIDSSEESNREPLNLDYVEGEFPVTTNRRPVAPNPVPSGFGDDLFSHHFDGFFGGNIFNPFENYGGIGFGPFNNYKPWFKGPNVCTTHEEHVEDDVKPNDKNVSSAEASFIHHFSLNVETCQETSNKHICKRVTDQGGNKKTVAITSSCCHGFKRGRNGFCEKFELLSMDQIGNKLNVKAFVKAAEKNELKEMTEANVTVFMPPDDVFMEVAQEVSDNNLESKSAQRNRREHNDISMKDLLLNHIVKSLVDIEDIDNEQILHSEYDNLTIRMNVFPKIRNNRRDQDDDFRYLYTVNCVPIIKANTFAENGIVHKIQKVLMPVEQNIMEIIRNHILKNHVMDLTFCSSAVIDDDAKVSAYNILGEKMIFERSNDIEDEKTTNDVRSKQTEASIMINEKAKIMEQDIMGTNGVVHIIDTVLETQSGLPISTMLTAHNLTIFKTLIDYGSFSNDFDNLNNATYFAPTDEAFETSIIGRYWMKQLEESPQKLKNNEKLKAFLDYHVVQPLTKSCDLSQEMLPTLNDGEPLRVNLYSTMPSFSNIINRATVNCARLIHFDQDSCGSVLHEVDKVLTPPTGNLFEMLENNTQYSSFLGLVKKANLSSLLEESSDDGLTLLVPRDDVFQEVGDWMKDKTETELKEIIKNHIVPEVVCCAGIVRSEWPFTRTVETISKNRLTLNRGRRPKVQNAGITKCDQIGTNGIIHEINDVIHIAQRHEAPPSNFYNTFFNRPFFF
ncbi:CLUMA_CG005715, isoform A [Clunio marinus]|uniref:CLUMA_CG005715, isoform A n=1 Tax=Clunio marinus TaxID=568069 RepID=A0A1J1HVU2_9DIPT|nr:CLUMA_CG005715, isoform A [Clunio marinus]